MEIKHEEPIIAWENAQGVIHNVSSHLCPPSSPSLTLSPQQLLKVGTDCKNKYGAGPNLIVVVLPDGATDVYTAVKHFGDIKLGVATQCLKSSKCSRAKPQYFANVSLKVNVKLGGINTIPDPRSVAILTDPHNPTIVMG